MKNVKIFKIKKENQEKSEKIKNTPKSIVISRNL